MNKKILFNNPKNFQSIFFLKTFFIVAIITAGFILSSSYLDSKKLTANENQRIQNNLCLSHQILITIVVSFVFITDKKANK